MIVTAGIAVMLIVLGVVITLVSSSSPTGPRTPSTTDPFAGLPAATEAPSTSIAASTSTSTTTPATPTTTTPPTTTTVPSPSVAPSQVLVEVLNGTGATGQAANVADALQADGFGINGTGDADAFTYRDNVIDYPPGQFAAASTLRSYLTGATTLRESTSGTAPVIQLVLGSSYDGLTRP